VSAPEPSPVLTPQKRALLEELHRRQGREVSSVSRTADGTWHAIARSARHESGPDRFPLSFSQSRLWFLEQLTPGKWHYNVPFALRLHSRISAVVLQRCVDEVLRRHESLRTVFRSEEGVPVQVILAQQPVQVQIKDLGALAAVERERELSRVTAEEARRPFQLEQGPLFRVTLVRLQETHYVLLMTMHHIISDAWSLGVLSRELGLLYEAYASGRPSPLTALPIQYADFAVWQRQWLSGEVLEKQLAYWREKLTDIEPLQLWTDRPRPVVASFAGAYRTASFGTELGRALRALGREEGCTPFMTLLAAFTALLSRYSGQDDVVVGTPIANRSRPELEGLIGFFVNTLVLRTDTSGDPSFRELLRRVRETALHAYAHQDLPFEKLVEELHPQRDLSRNPLFQVAFQLWNTPATASQAPDDAADPVAVFGVAKFDLTFNMWERGDELCCQVEYSTDLFLPATIDRLLLHFERLLSSAAAAPDARLSRLDLLSESERALALADWIAPQREYPRESSVVALFTTQASRTPEHLAVDFAVADGSGPACMTYRELDLASDRIARHLLDRGVQPGDSVGLLLPRSPLLVASMLGILKAGAVYVPLDSTFPNARINQIIGDCGARIVLSTSVIESALGRSALPGVEIVRADADTIEADEAPLPDRRLGSDVAYIMYTSGSTGTPKGAMIPHRAIARLVLDTDYASLGPKVRIAHVSNCAFDAATFEIWGALLNGGCIVGIEKDVTLSPHEFAAVLKERAVTTLFLTTALFNLVARSVPWAFGSLSDVLFGGEAADPDCVRAVLRHGPPLRLANVYGPTENTTFSLWQPITSLGEEETAVPIGRAIANSRAVVLDRFGRPVPLGCPGELYLGGDGLALGYLNRRELDADRFVDIACGPAPPMRAYRTGDRVRLRPDGAIEFIERIDRQLKIRGFRVEPGEVEAVLKRHPDVLEAVVLPSEHPGPSRRLVAFAVAREGTTASAMSEVLRGWLAERLPEFMVPAAIGILVELPLNRSGKVDRRALPDVRSALTDATAFEPPRDDLESALIAIWREVLKVERLGTRDNFFDVGGHSLLLAQIHDQLRERLGAHVSILDLFRYPTIAALAAHLRQGAVTSDGRPAATDDLRLREAADRGRRERQARRERFPSLSTPPRP